MTWFRSGRRGASAIVTAVASVPLVIAVGVAVDYVRLSLVRSELQRSVDAAALAGARVLVGYPPNDAQVGGDARMYFWANFRDYVADAAVVGGEPTISVIEPERIHVKVEAVADVPMAFGALLGVSSIQARATSTAQRYSRGMEVVLALDTTTSMWGSRIANMKQGANDLLDILYGATNNERSVPTCRQEVVNGTPTTVCGMGYSVVVGLVPFAATVNIGPDRGSGSSAMPNIVAPSDVAARNWGSSVYGPGAWKGCVAARPSPYEEAQAEALPSTSPFLPYYWAPTPATVTWQGIEYEGPNFWVPDDSDPMNPGTTEWWSRVPWGGPQADNRQIGWYEWWDKGPNRGCGYPILPLQPYKDIAKSRINALEISPPNGTTVTLGLAWSWRLLSPAWRPFWQGGTWTHYIDDYTYATASTQTPTAMPVDYDTGKMDKIVVLMTDGQNEMGKGLPVDSVEACCTNAYGDWATRPLGASPVTELNSRTVQLCNAMKAKGVKIFVILLYDSPPASVLNMYNENGCASGANFFFNSPNGDDLRTIFRAVGSQLSNLRLVN